MPGARAAQPLDTVDVDGCGGGDALIEEEIFAAPDAGIAIGFGFKQADGGAESISALERLDG